MIAIKTNELSKKYKDKFALRRLNIKILEGEIFALLGTNGAGKTTTIKILSTLIAPSDGVASVFGYDIINDKQKIRELINVSPQQTAIAPNLSVIENLEFMAGVYSIKNPKEKINLLIEQFGLNEVLKQKAKTLSGGWQRKLSIALSLINDPELLFLDEPTLGLDVLARRELWQIIDGLRGKITIILTTHYMEEAESLSDRVGIMHKGELIATGTPNEIKAMSNKDSFEDAFTFIVSGGKL